MGTSNGFNKNKAMKLLALAVIFPSSILIILYILQQAPMQKIIKKGRQNDCTTISTSQSSKINSDKLDFIMSSFLEPGTDKFLSFLLEITGISQLDSTYDRLKMWRFYLIYFPNMEIYNYGWGLGKASKKVILITLGSDPC